MEEFVGVGQRIGRVCGSWAKDWKSLWELGKGLEEFVGVEGVMLEVY